MADIKKELNDIKNAVYGKEVRGSIHDGIKKINDEVENATDLSESAKHQVENIQQQVNQLVVEGDSSVEAAQARVDAEGKSYPTLKARLDAKETEFSSQLAQKASQTELNILKQNVSELDVRKAEKTELKKTNNELEGINTRIDNLILESGGDSNLEVADARHSVPKNKTFETLGERLNESDQEFLDLRDKNAILLLNEVNGKGDSRDGWNWNRHDGVGDLELTDNGFFVVNTSKTIVVYHPLEFNNSDLIYISVNYFADGLAVNSSLDFILRNDSTSASEPFRLFGDITTATYKSGIIRANSDGNRMYIQRWNVGSEYYFNNLVVLNLTKTFGKGNEPTKEVMDKFMQRYAERYFDGEEYFDLVSYLIQRSKTKSNHLFNDIQGTKQKIIFNKDGSVQKINHVDIGSNSILREDIFTFEENKITEKRTLTVTNESITFIYDLDTYEVEVI